MVIRIEMEVRLKRVKLVCIFRKDDYYYYIIEADSGEDRDYLSFKSVGKMSEDKIKTMSLIKGKKIHFHKNISLHLMKFINLEESIKEFDYYSKKRVYKNNNYLYIENGIAKEEDSLYFINTDNGEKKHSQIGNFIKKLILKRGTFYIKNLKAGVSML